MRALVCGVVSVVAVVALAGCEREPAKVAAAERVVAQAQAYGQDGGAAWPLMLAHCLRAPVCDPASDFGSGAGQASGVVEQANWFVESAEVVKEGGADYGAAVRVSLYATRAAGGKAGRPLTIDEVEASLRAANARRSTLSVEYRTPGGGAPEAHGLTFFSAQVRLPVPALETAKSPEALADMTGAYVDAMKWPDGETGAKIEITGKAGVLVSEYSAGLAAQDIIRSKEAMKRGFEPWVFYIPRNLRDKPLPALMQAIADGETLGLKISAPDGVILSDAIYTAGYEAALQEATQALADPELARPVLERCARFANEKPEFWKIADVTAALRVCDSRTPLQRSQGSALPPPGQ